MSFSYICVKKKENTAAIANEWRRFSESSPKRSAFKCTLWRGSTQWPLTITVVLLESTYLSFDYAVWQIKLQKREYACVNAGPRGSSKDQKQTSWKNTMTVQVKKRPPSNNPSRGLASASCIINFPCYWWDTVAQEPRFVSETRHGRQSSRLRNSEGVFSFVH